MKACMSEEKIVQFSSFNWSRSADVIILKPDVLPLNIPFFLLFEIFNLNANWKFSIKSLEGVVGIFVAGNLFISKHEYFLALKERIACNASTPSVLFDFYCLSITILLAYRIGSSCSCLLLLFVYLTEFYFSFACLLAKVK